MFQVFGGGDPLALAKGWGLYGPDEMANGARAAITSILDRLDAHDAWTRTAEALQRGRAAFAPYGDRIPLGGVTCGLLIADKGRANPLDRGYTGFGGIPGYVLVVYSDPNDYTLPRLGGAAVHELNHNVRFSVFPFNLMSVTVGEYIVAEGLAEAFAAELFGEDLVGYYVTDFDQAELATAQRVIADALDVSGFDAVRSYIFGDTISAQMGRPAVGVPNYAGYAIGYRVVRRYLDRTGVTVAQATLVPAAEIIATSGYFA